MRVYDGFIFNDELELLELRLLEIGDLVDKIVLVESNLNWQKQPKLLWFQSYKREFKRWEDKIHHIILEQEPAEPPKMEHFQRKSLFDGFDGAEMDDICLLSDADEIPSRQAIQKVKEFPPRFPVAFSQRLYYYYVNCLQKQPWAGTIAFQRGVGKFDMQNLRDQRNCLPSIPDGGWHFAWCGSVDKIQYKLNCHTIEYDLHAYGGDFKAPPTDQAHIQECLDTGKDLFLRESDYAKKKFVHIDPGKMHPEKIEEWLDNHPSYAKPMNVEAAI